MDFIFYLCTTLYITNQHSTMNQDNTTERMQTLIAQLNRASDAYYNGKGELMTDYEWDALFDQLKQLEESSGVILPGSPTHRVSADAIAGQKETHEYPALSLAKTKKPADVAKWAEMKPIWMSWKLDGLTLVATYDNGRLTRLVTRGNGHTGTNITHLAQAVDGVLSTIAYQGHTVIRGEAVISYHDFEQFNMESDEEYANPRNLASGSLTLKNVEEVKQRHLQWIPFTLVHTDEHIVSWGKRMDWLESLGFHPVEHQLIAQPSLVNVEAAIDHWTQKVNTMPFPVDGLVVAYDDTDYAQTGSVTGHHATRAGYAFKWQDESAESELDHVEWSCAASTISPVAVFRPVQLEGTTVKRASLCNVSECKRLGIGGKGTSLEIIKANKIIPKVIRVHKKVGELDIPGTCPVCGAPTHIAVSPASGTETLHCSNAGCPAKQLKKFARFVSKDGVNIDGMSEQTVARLINLGWVKDYSDLFHLSVHAQAMAGLDGFGRKSVDNILQSIERARRVDSRHLLYALCIPLCGKDVCQRLLGSYPLHELVAIARGEDGHKAGELFPSGTQALATIPGIGPEKSASFVKWFCNETNMEMFNRLLHELHIAEPAPVSQGEKCKGLTFVITGDVHHYKNRNELKAYIESQGGKVTGSVSKSTSFLINNDVSSTSGKNMKARQLGTPVISEDDFIKTFC